MKKNIFLVLFTSFVTTFCFSQLPSAYKLVKGESEVGRDDYYTNGRIKIVNNVVQEFGDGDAENWINDFYNGFMVTKTKDGLVVGTGNYQGIYIYIIFKGQVYYQVSTKNNSKEFSDMSIFVLKKVRKLGTLFLQK